MLNDLIVEFVQSRSERLDMNVAVLQIERAQQRVDFIGLFVSIVVGVKFSSAEVRFLLVEELAMRTTKTSNV